MIPDSDRRRRTTERWQVRAVVFALTRMRVAREEMPTHFPRGLRPLSQRGHRPQDYRQAVKEMTD